MNMHKQVKITCKICALEFTSYPSSERIYCGFACVYIARKAFKGRLAHNWKGENVGYAQKHNWMKTTYGRPNYCENCKITKAPDNKNAKSYFQWANISHEYKRDRSDWKRLCALCHKRFDSNTTARGERQHMAKLNEHQIHRIRLMKEIQPKLTQAKIAKMFAVNQSNISCILTKKIWKHLV